MNNVSYCKPLEKVKDAKMGGIKLATKAFDWVVCGENIH